MIGPTGRADFSDTGPERRIFRISERARRSPDEPQQKKASDDITILCRERGLLW